MFLDTGSDGKDIRVENNILGRKVDFSGENSVGARTNLDFTFDRIRLTFFVERHHDNRGTVAHNLAGLFAEKLFTFFKADRIHDRLARIETGFDNGPFRGVDHDGDTADARFRCDQLEKVSIASSDSSIASSILTSMI